jgi:starvation-inducible DNA-binding protein
MDIPAETRRTVIDLLLPLLADALELGLQAKQAHWNVRGMSFVALHELFEQTAGVAFEHADLLAERIVQLGGDAPGSSRRVTARTRLGEYPSNTYDGKAHVEALAQAMAKFAAEGRQVIDRAAAAGDAVTSDIATEIVRASDKSLWMLEAHLTPERGGHA